MSADTERAVALFIATLDVSREVAVGLVHAGFATLEEVAYVPIVEFATLRLLAETEVQALRNRARHALLARVLAGPGDSEPLAPDVDHPRGPRPLASGSAVIADDKENP